MKIERRPYQEQAIKRIQHELHNKRRVLAVGPTGSGKTVIAAVLIQRDDAKAKRDDEIATTRHPPCITCGGAVIVHEEESVSRWLERRSCSRACTIEHLRAVGQVRANEQHPGCCLCGGAVARKPEEERWKWRQRRYCGCSAGRGSRSGMSVAGVWLSDTEIAEITGLSAAIVAARRRARQPIRRLRVGRPPGGRNKVLSIGVGVR